VSTLFTEHFGVRPQWLYRQGALDMPLNGAEAHVYFDPRLVRKTHTPEFQGAMSDLGSHFADIIHRIVASQRADGRVKQRIEESIRRSLAFPEIAGLRIGHGKDLGTGRGVGPKRALNMFNLASEFVQAGLDNPELLEMLTVVDKGIGADLISDMIAHIARPRLYTFTERVAQSLNVPTRRFSYGEKNFELPWNPFDDSPIVLPPSDCIADLPTFQRFSRFDRIAYSNETLREVFDNWIRDHVNARPVQFFQAHSELIEVAMAAYVETTPPVHDVLKGTGVKIAASELKEALRDKNKDQTPTISAETLHLSVLDLCSRFKRLIEHQGKWKVLYGTDGKARDEPYVQELFALSADSYCLDRNIAISPETDAGSGPVDFKFDQGAVAVSLVEVKLSHNKKLISGYKHQVEAYKKANMTKKAVYLVIDVHEEVSQLQKLVDLYEEQRRERDEAPDLIIVDGRTQPSASKRVEEIRSLPQPTPFVGPAPHSKEA
jgi:hypothetical protein